MKLAVAIIFYNPTEENIRNTILLANEADKIIIIDNSDKNVFNKKIDDILMLCGDKVIYIKNEVNIGIASALNMACAMAIELGYDYILTMDQDSRFDDKNLSSYISSIQSFINKSKVAVFSPNYITKKRYKSKSVQYKLVGTAITSGSIINLNIFKKIGGYIDDLFIDEVDNEYCLRARLEGFQVVQFPFIYLNHNLGQTQKLFCGLSHKTHQPIRSYYMSRNILYICKKYFTSNPFYVIRILVMFLIKIASILLFETQKKEKIKYIINGIHDFYVNKYGAYKL